MHAPDRANLLEPFFAPGLIAHRGDHSRHPENSLEAFADAAARGLPFECDVRLSADSELIVSHDDSLERVAGHELVVSRSSAHEIAEVRYETEAGSGAYRVPSLSDLLGAGIGPCMIEVKVEADRADEAAGSMVRVLAGHPGAEAGIVVASFCRPFLRRLRAERPDVARMQLAGSARNREWSSVRRSLAARAVRTASSASHAIGAAFELAGPGPVRHWKRAGLGVFLWTARSREDIACGRAIGADCIISDWLEDT